MKTAIVLGTRPEIIKMSPIISELESRNKDYFILHTGQHYSYNMDESFFEEMDIPKPKYNLGVRSKAPIMQGDHTGRMMILIEEILLKEKPDNVLVLGDTNTVLAASICTAKFRTSSMSTKLGHVEAGLRSFERTLPEEINRVVSDALSDIMFAPTHHAESNLLKENIDKNRVHVTGNTVVDALEKFHNRLNENILEKFNVTRNNYILLTAHREYNIDFTEKFLDIIKGVERVSKKLGIVAVYPVHPRAKRTIESLGIDLPECIKLSDPVGYIDFLTLQKCAKLVLTDSGGVQEESCILGTPCVTLREKTERPETITAGANALSGTDPERILETSMRMVEHKNWIHPFGDGTAAKRIVDILDVK